MVQTTLSFYRRYGENWGKWIFTKKKHYIKRFLGCCRTSTFIYSLHQDHDLLGTLGLNWQIVWQPLENPTHTH